MKKLYSVVAVLSAGLSLAQIPTNSLVARYNFDYHPSQPSALFYSDNSGNGNDLCDIDPNSIVYITNGFTNGIGDHSGYYSMVSGLKTCFSNSGFQAGSVSISAWIYITGFQQWNTIACVRINNTTSPYNSVILCTGSYASYKLAFGFTTTGAGETLMTGNTTLSTNVWYHVVATYDETTGNARIYLNGNLEGTISVSPASPIAYTNGFFSIGNIPSGIGSNGFYGQIDNVLYYSRVLTPAEITQIYNTVTTQISQVQNNIAKNIYPIPASNELTIEVEKSTKGKITNILGQNIKEIELTAGTNTIDINDLEKGIYFISFPTGEVKKFSKE
ncbi:MAG: T9SS type A sorting domain-containing protein [Bacteroidia bacterium]|nr:T9SS type A sorting domain-containing protein [Bacteroidia bacterium]